MAFRAIHGYKIDNLNISNPLSKFTAEQFAPWILGELCMNNVRIKLLKKQIG